MSGNGVSRGNSSGDMEHHYLCCEFCGRDQTEWSAIVNRGGEVVQLECKRCGGTAWERAQEASHV